MKSLTQFIMSKKSHIYVEGENSENPILDNMIYLNINKNNFIMIFYIILKNKFKSNLFS